MLELVPVIRVLGLILLISGFKNIQNAYVSRHLLFKKYFFATLGGTITAAFVGIIMAYNGLGIWALVAQNLVNQLIDTIILWITVKWRPTREFSLDRLKKLFSYASKLLLSSLLDTVWGQLRQLIIGKKYSSTDLAFYNKGNEYPNYAVIALNSSIDSVLLPVMSKEQDNPQNVKAMTRRAIKTSSFILWPMMMGFAACSRAFVSIVLTDKWLPSVPYLIIFCIVYAFYPIHTANLNAIKALGRSDLFLKLEIIKKIVSLGIILVTMWYGPLWLAIGSIVGSALSQIINTWPNRKLLGYKYHEQIMDIFPYISLSVVMAIIVYCIGNLNINNIIVLIIQVLVGIALYLGMAMAFKVDTLKYLQNFFKFESFTYCFNIIKKLLKRN